MTISNSFILSRCQMGSTQAPPDGPQDENDEAREQFMLALSSSIDVFVNRMSSNSARGRSIINDSAVQTLFATLQNMHPQLLSYIQSQEDKRCKLSLRIRSR